MKSIAYKKGFTLVEVVIVVVIAAILLAMTFNLGRDYIQFLKFKQDRENFVNLIDKTIIRTRATNYYEGVKYTYLDMTVHEDGLDIRYGTGDSLSTSSPDVCGGGILLDSYNFSDTVLTGDAGTIRIVPFAIECGGQPIGGSNNNTCVPATGLDLSLVSQISNDTTCYTFDLEVCKFILVTCS